ncbi:MAG: TnsA endonuclease N-terminal domain-containing protein [Clostridium sp.]|uniref:TnsA endonuclease C-terminal domain-containing protein n=1 Tax=Clostridium sp. TaxID=1506 RepID=UPI0025C3266A|nr:TnsA endonuclease N-terminal domain-containing protein [Clostridium sp.]MCH3965727.1 TnsA endonuclease N-terminal domain-containing protein [Clostridium sp.]MCI1717103.1 TnsA endonuclease N-terminal domain-containing protein [Clostridium sp.]MCI1801360.1 TnsA endonuclease N-terminal domain-containing protein [Clostridium sp.]MCI1815206.1 TnsA endonuclease N-terminal domain-containing protein [Clostridium sp.]MCI1872109.1 TnsA endonuclease N-terminal domain-containing protein [Clostridium sp
MANELGLEHPKNPKTGEYVVMTTDFLITKNDDNKLTEVARTIKAKDKLFNKRILEKFEIERVYWEKRKIDWGIVTENEIDKTIATNISFAYGYKNIKDLDCFEGIEKLEFIDLIYEFIKRIVGSNKTMRTICNTFDKDMSLEIGSGLSIFKYLIINKIIEVNIVEKIDVNKVIPITNVIEKSINKLEAI